jgi:uncharacterized protein YcfJ
LLKEIDMRAFTTPATQTTQEPSFRALVLALAGALASNAAFAGPAVGTVVGTPSTTTTTVQARVVSSTPVVAQVAVPRDVCFDELQTQEATPSGAGALLGAVAGAAVGNAAGKGSGRALATGVGLIGGAILGNHIENRGRPSETHTVRRCEQQTSYENKVVAYSVVYELGGQRYTTQMPSEPGQSIAVQMSVSPVTSVVNTPVVYAPSQQPVRYVSHVIRPPAHVVVVNRRDNDRWHHGHRPHVEQVSYVVRDKRYPERHGRPQWD